VPLVVGEKIIGTLDVHSKVNRHAFTAAHLQTLKMLASQAAIAIENARLYEAVRRARDELEERVQQRTAELEASNAQLQQEIGERKRAEAALRQSQNRLANIVNSATDAIVTLDAEQRIMLFNTAAEQMFRCTAAQAIGQPLDQFIPERFRLSHQEHIHVFGQTGITSRSMGTPGAVWGLRASGEEFPVEASISQVEVAGQKFYTVILRDITERKRAEEKLKQTLTELARSNAELQQFAYVASHDLQEPLRMVASYTELLARRYQGRLDADADEFIAFAVDGANRMQRLINDLLAYSRVDTRGKAPEPTDAGAALTEALANLEAAMAENEAVVTHDPLPTVPADETQLVQLFQNLVGNALKFRSARHACIHVSATQQGKEWVFSVQDNGIGIEPQYAERIFVIFQRLHTQADYPGTGIGLAICKRIVERHGGHIWLESQPGQGATFYFSLPKEGVKRYE
jgi:PAS domain S-box-containing protein